MSNIVENKTFEEKMKDRIKDSIGDMISDSDLSKLVNKGIQEVFFEKRTVKSDSWNTKEIPPLLHEIITECLNDKVKECINTYIKNNNEIVLGQVNEVVSEGVGMAVLKALNNKFSSDIWMMENNIIQKLRNGTM